MLCSCTTVVSHSIKKKKASQHIEQFGLCDLQKDSECCSLFSDGLYRGANKLLSNPREKENFHTGFFVCTITKLTFDIWRHIQGWKNNEKLVFDTSLLVANYIRLLCREAYVSTASTRVVEVILHYELITSLWSNNS